MYHNERISSHLGLRMSSETVSVPKRAQLRTTWEYLKHSILISSKNLRRRLAGRSILHKSDWARSSIYRQLNGKQRFVLDLVIRSYCFGQFDLAFQILLAYLPYQESSPLISQIYADTCRFMGMYRVGAKYLATALPDLHDKQLSVDAQSQLLAVSYHMDRLYAEGCVRESLDAARRLRGWLATVKLEDYSDVMVLAPISSQKAV